MTTSQDQRIAAVLLKLELVSHGSCQAWNPSGGQSGEPDDKVFGQVERGCGHQSDGDEWCRHCDPHIRYRIQYRRQQTDLGREAVIGDAEAELAAWTGTAPRAKIDGKSLVDLILEDGEGWEPKIVAQRYGVDEAFVRRKRMHADPPRGSEDGKKLMPDPEPIDRSEKAREFRARGMSTRMIAETLGVSQSAVMKWIRRAAA